MGSTVQGQSPAAERERKMKQISDDIKSGSLKQVYLLYGEERYLCRQYREKLKSALCDEGDTMNTHFFEGKNINIGEMIDLAETMPFLAQRRVIFVQNSGLFKAGGEKLAEYLADLCPTTYFVFCESEVDKRSKLYKAVAAKGHAAEFAVQDEATLKRWVAGVLAKDGKKIRESTVLLLLNKVGTDMNNLQMELEKLSCYCLDREVITDADVEAVCTTRVTNHIFDMVDAIANKQTERAFQLYYDLLTLKEAPLRILALIARHCNQLLQVKELKTKGLDNRSIASKIGVPPFAVNKLASQASRFRTPALRLAVTQCVEAEEAVKSGRMNDKMSVELLILNVLL